MLDKEFSFLDFWIYFIDLLLKTLIVHQKVASQDNI